MDEGVVPGGEDVGDAENIVALTDGWTESDFLFLFLDYFFLDHKVFIKVGVED